MDQNNRFWEFYQENRGKIWGGLIGFIAAIVILQFGFFSFLLIAAFVVVGVILGSSQENRTRIAQFFDRLFEKKEK